jgi:hypothetical protein
MVSAGSGVFIWLSSAAFESYLMVQKLRWEAGHHGVPVASSAMVPEALQAFFDQAH